MAQQGKSQTALYICFISSLVGGLFGMVIMILFTPPLARIAMKFGPVRDVLDRHFRHQRSWPGSLRDPSPRD